MIDLLFVGFCVSKSRNEISKISGSSVVSLSGLEQGTSPLVQRGFDLDDLMSPLLLFFFLSHGIWKQKYGLLC